MLEKSQYFIYDCLIVGGLSFLFGVAVLASVEAGQWKERNLLEQVCKVNGQVVINDNVYQCGIVEDVK